MTAAWHIVAENGERAHFEASIRGAIVRYRPAASKGGPVEVSLNGGQTWFYGFASSLRFAEISAESLIDAMRATNAVRANPRGMSIRQRLGIASADSGSAAHRATRGPGAARAARRSPEGTSGGSERAELRTGADAPPSWVRWDDPQAAELALEHVTTALDRSIETKGGNDALFGVAVAIVRGFCLLPDGAAANVIAAWNRTEAVPPWSPQVLRRALERAERIGNLPWGVLLSRTPTGRTLVGRWMRDARARAAGGRGAGKGVRS